MAVAILVFPEDFDVSSAAQRFPRLFADKTNTSGWDPAGIRDGHLSHSQSAMGFHLVTLRFSGNMEYDDAAAYRAILAELTRLGEDYSAQYGFVCEHDYQAEERWLENEVLSPLLAQDMEALGRIVARQVLIEASAR